MVFLVENAEQETEKIEAVDWADAEDICYDHGLTLLGEFFEDGEVHSTVLQ